ncbi:MAG: alpha/beta fold hydrolase, partial [Candidatus Dormibacteraeota bacterium]|nr:alpha/beta fold hydrolase [Candidatus Dormibacteraeota bacterium]
MKLFVREWGTGDRVAILIHGITSDSRSWLRVGPALAERGYHVLAPDLRGHGQSPRGEYSAQLWADDVVETLPAGAEVAIGHSLGGQVLAVAVERLRPQKAVYEDPAWVFPARTEPADGGGFEARKRWTPDDIRRENPRWTEAEREASLASIAAWDESSARTWLDGREHDYMPRTPVVPSLVLLADPSYLIPPERAEKLRGWGFEVRAVKGAGHSIHRDDLEGFLAGLEGWVRPAAA